MLFDLGWKMLTMGNLFIKTVLGDNPIQSHGILRPTHHFIITGPRIILRWYVALMPWLVSLLDNLLHIQV